MAPTLTVVATWWFKLIWKNEKLGTIDKLKTYTTFQANIRPIKEPESLSMFISFIRVVRYISLYNSVGRV